MIRSGTTRGTFGTKQSESKPVEMRRRESIIGLASLPDRETIVITDSVSQKMAWLDFKQQTSSLPASLLYVSRANDALITR